MTDDSDHGNGLAEAGYRNTLCRREFLKQAAAISAAAAMAPSVIGLLSGSGCAISGRTAFSEAQIKRILDRGLSRGGSFSELYLEDVISLTFKLTEGRFSEASVGVVRGAGVRTVDGERHGYGYANGWDYAQVLEAAEVSAHIASQEAIKAQVAGPRRVTPPRFVNVMVPLQSITEKQKMEIVARAETAARRYSPYVRQVDITYYDEIKRRFIATSDGLRMENELPLIWIVIEVLAERNGVRHQGRTRLSARQGFEFFQENDLAKATVEAATEAVVMLDARPSPAGMMPVVMHSGWGGVLIHEAVGHGLEGDLVYRGSSIYADKLGRKVGSDLVTLIDDSSLPNARGTTEFDDEGTIGRRNVLINRGVVEGFMHDRISAAMLRQTPTGNGRRESYRFPPMPRMTNTFLENGDDDPQAIISSTKRGIYVKALSGGSVDTISGQFNFIVRESYLIENGRLTQPVTGATLIGRGIDVLANIDAVANDLTLGVGTCGKGQWVPVTSGIPTLRVARGIMVGGQG